MTRGDGLNTYFNTSSIEGEKYYQTCFTLRNGLNYTRILPEKNLDTMLEKIITHSAEVLRTPP